MKNSLKNLTSTRREDWETPKWLFDFLNGECQFNFSIDLAATKDNRLCSNYVSPENDFLKLGADGVKNNLFWFHNFDRYWCWCNPPYGPRGLSSWIKPLLEIDNIVALVPASVGAKWFTPIWQQSDVIVFLKKRLKFGNAEAGAMFDSALFLKGNLLTRDMVKELKKIGHVVTHPGIHTVGKR